MMSIQKFSTRNDALKELERAKRVTQSSVKIFPGPECKDVAADLLRWNIQTWLESGRSLESLENKLTLDLRDPQKEIAHNVRSHQTLNFTATRYFCIALGIAVLDGKGEAWANFREAEALLHATHQHQQADHRTQEETWERASGSVEDFYLFSRSVDAEDLSDAKFVGAYLHNALYRGSTPIQASVQDVHFLEFMWLLVLSFSQQQWVTSERIEESNLGIYKGLMRSVGTPDFSSELLVFLDNRLAQSFGLPYFGASKRIPGNGSELFLPMWEPYSLFPFELLALRGVARFCGFNDISIQVDHPILTAFNQIPVLQPFVESNLCHEIHSVGRDVYGGRWDLMAPFDLLE